MDLSRFINFRSRSSLVVTTVLLTIIGLLLFWLGNSVYNLSSSRFDFIQYIPEAIIGIFFLLYLVVIYLVIVELFRIGWNWFIGLRNSKYTFSNRDWPEKWLFSGNPEASGSSELLIKWTRAGCLLKDYSWKNFRMACELKFLDGFDQTIGFVFRAENLDNYFMIELSSKHNNIKPHVRYKGGWDILEPFPKNYNYKDYFSVVLEVKDDTALLFIDKHLEYTWILPTHVDVFYRESGVQASSDDQDQKKDEDRGRKVAEHVQEIPFRSESGKIGFRAHPGQGAIIRGLKIKSL